MLKLAKTGVKQAKMDLFAYLQPPKTYLNLVNIWVEVVKGTKKPILPHLWVLCWYWYSELAVRSCLLIVAGINLKTLN